MNDFSLLQLIADGAVVPVVLVGAYVLIRYVPNHKRLRVYATILLAGVTAYLFARFASVIWQPSELRPFELLGVDPGASYLDNPGFPSDHMVFVTAIVCAVWYGTRMKRVTFVLLGCALLVGIGRVLALVHAPIDIVGGIAAGLLGALWYLHDDVLKSKKATKNG